MVGKICTICRSRSVIDKDLSYFIYPADPVRRHEWLNAVNRLDLMDKLDDERTRGNYRICEIHFEPRYIHKSKLSAGRKFLSKDAVPTMYVSGTPNSMFSITSDNFLKPTKPIPITNAEHLIWNRKNDPQHEAVVSKNNLRPIRVKIKKVDNVKGDESPKEIKKGVLIKIKQAVAAPICEDASQFCESVMKISQSTQTATTSHYKSAIDTINTEKKFSQICSKFLSPNLSKLIKWKACPANGKHVNFTLFALNLYYSTNLYNFLSDMLNLPSRDTLKYFLLPKTTNVNAQFFNALKCKVNNMSIREKICSFSVGSILLKPSLYYDIKFDRIIGFHDINGIQKITLAKYAILLMVQGILEDWQQPIAYAFISGYDNIPEISIWIDDVLTSLIDIGLNVRAFVSDPRSEFLYASESKFVTPHKTSFTINGTDIFYIYDTSYLLKIVKNNLKSCNFYYDSDSQKCNNMEFFEKINNLCNSNSQYNRAFSNKNYQKNFFNHMKQLFQNLKVVRKTDSTDVTENMKFIEKFQISINSIENLFEELQILDVKYLVASRLTHNKIKNFFAQVKKKSSKNECTPRQFNKKFVRSFVFNALKIPISRENLETMIAEQHAQALLDEEVEETGSVNNKPLLVKTVDYRDNLPEKNAFVFICGYCYLKCIQIHNCDTFQNYVRLTKQENEDMPPDDFTGYLLFLEYKFKGFFKENLQISSIGQEILKEFQECDFDMPCPCFPVDYLKQLFIRIRLYYTIRKNNRMIKQKKGLKSFRAFSL